MRRLTLVPIVHSEADLGRLADSVWQEKVRVYGERAAQESRDKVTRYWESLTELLEERFPSFEGIKVFQDGLPVAQGVERKITEDLAAQGSANHRLILRMLDGGAELGGTESPELLIEEYRRAQAALETGAPSIDDDASRNLLDRRDQFIAKRVDECLPAEGQGVLLLGLLHNVIEKLPDDLDLEALFPQTN